ncbi:MAG: ATP-binding protein [Kiritimatiellia bacterium]
MSSTAEIERLLASLRRALHAERLAHAYLLTGRSRTLLRQAALEIVALVYCRESTLSRPCHKCRGCHQAAERSHPDLLWIEPQSKSRRIVVEQAHRMREHVMRSAFAGGCKIVVLEDVDRLQDEAANIILKTLEEPPSDSLFLLLTDSPSALITTVVSRCQRLTLTGVNEEDSRVCRALVVQVMSAAGEQGVMPALARARALMERLQEIRKTIAEEDPPADNPNMDLEKNLREKMEAIRTARLEARYRDRRETILEWLMLWHRDLLLCLCGVEEEHLAFQESAARLRADAAGLTYARALANIGIIEEMQAQLARHLPEATVFEHGFVRLEA